jgi:hypothetical protein
MFDLPVMMSMLGVRWHLEHLAISGEEKMLYLLPPDDEEELFVDVMESSLVTWRTFCCG